MAVFMFSFLNTGAVPVPEQRGPGTGEGTALGGLAWGWSSGSRGAEVQAAPAGLGLRSECVRVAVIRLLTVGNELHRAKRKLEESQGPKPELEVYLNSWCQYKQM